MINEDISCKSQRQHDNALYVYIHRNIFIYSFISAKREGYDSTKIEEQIYYVEHVLLIRSVYMCMNTFRFNILHFPSHMITFK